METRRLLPDVPPVAVEWRLPSVPIGAAVSFGVDSSCSCDWAGLGLVPSGAAAETAGSLMMMMNAGIRPYIPRE